MSFSKKLISDLWIALSAICVLFGLALSGLWSNVYSELQVVSGMLFLSDAHQYYTDALSLLNGFPLPSFSARHPLPTLFLAFLLLVTGKNLQLSLACLVLIVAFSTFSASHQVVKISGSIGAAVFVLTVFFFQRRFIGIPDSEDIGLSLGCLAFSCLFMGNNRNSEFLRFLGIFTLSMALFARPGAFFVLPALIVWIYYINHNNFRKALFYCFLGLLIILLSFISQYATNIFIAEEESHLFSNYSFHIYGIAKGGKGWEQFFKDFPEYQQFAENEATEYAWRETQVLIKTYPDQLLRGVIQSYADYFSLQNQSVFGFLSGGELTSFNTDVDKSINLSYRIVRLIVSFLSLIGFWHVVRERYMANHSLMISIVIGIILSIPFLPPKDAGMMRVFASTIPFVAILPALGVKHLMLTRNQGEFDSWSNQTKSERVIQRLSVGLIILITFGSIIVGLMNKEVNIDEEKSCQKYGIAASLHIPHGSFIAIVDDMQLEQTRIPYIRYSDFKSSISNFHRDELIDSLMEIPINSIVLNTVDMRDGERFWAILPIESYYSIGKYVNVCGKWHDGFLQRGYGFLIVNHVENTEALE